ncbi:MAG: hypothetical protein ACM3QS_13740 [Bacteroidota bacterium]
MDRPTFQVHQTVHEILSKWPQANRAFRALKTGCVGCYLARFCSLKDVANTYNIPVERLVEALEEAALESNSSSRSSQ